jgi:hypothetical protein
MGKCEPEFCSAAISTIKYIRQQNVMACASKEYFPTEFLVSDIYSNVPHKKTGLRIGNKQCVLLSRL